MKLHKKINFSHTQILVEFDERLKASLTEDVDESFVAKLRSLYFDLLSDNQIRGVTDYPFLYNKTVTLPTRISDKRVLLFPGVVADSRLGLELRLNFFKSFNRKFGEPKLNERGMSGANAYAHDVSKVMSVPGIYPNKGGAHPSDNSWHRHELGLGNDWVDQRDAEFSRKFFRLLFGVVESTPVRIPGQSQSVLPMMLYGRGYKTLNFIYAAQNRGRIYDLLRKRDLEGLQNQFDITFAYLQGERTQPDAAGKIRKVILREHANQDRYPEVVIDNSVHINGITDALTKHFSTIRFRYVWGMCNTVNSFINCVGGSAREVYGKVYEFTFKHRSIDHMRSKMRIFDSGSDDGLYPTLESVKSVFLDVTSYDRAMLYRFLEVMVNNWGDSDFGNFVRHSVFAPLIVRSNDKGTTSDTLYQNGDPLNFDPSDHQKQGLLSGWGWVSDAGKWAAFVIYLVGIKAGICSYSIDELDLFLKGKHPEFACFNLGDDNVVFGRPDSISKWERTFKDNGYWVFDYEPGCRFIGHIFHEDGNGRYKISNDPVSAITNILTPERSWQSKLRRFPAHGIRNKLSQLDAPFSYDIFKLFKKVYYETIGEDFDLMINREIEKEREMMDEEISNGISLRWLNDHYGEDLHLRSQMISDILRDESVVRWKYSTDDFKKGFGVDISKIEDRPDVHFSDLIIRDAGYKQFSRKGRFSSKLDDDAGGIYVHYSEWDDVNKILEINAKLYEESL